MKTTRAKLITSAVILALLGVVVSGTVHSAFSTTTSNAGNSYGAGTVALSDNDAGSALFSMSNLKPGDTLTKCIKVDYTGSLTSAVKLYGTTGGTGLDQYLDLVVRRGSFPGAPPASNACTGFSSAATIHSGTLTAFPDSYAAGLDEGSWTNGTSNVYEITVTLQDNNSAQGLTATQTFTWEARSS